MKVTEIELVTLNNFNKELIVISKSAELDNVTHPLIRAKVLSDQGFTLDIDWGIPRLNGINILNNIESKIKPKSTKIEFEQDKLDCVDEEVSQKKVQKKTNVYIESIGLSLSDIDL